MPWRDRPGPTGLARLWLKKVGEYVRNVVAAAVFAYLLSLVATRTVGGAVRLGALVWLGFQAVASPVRWRMSTTRPDCTYCTSAMR
jgi:hypothetical protein